MRSSIDSTYIAPAASAVGKRGGAWSSRRATRLFRRVHPYLYLAPALILLGIWMYRPLVQTLYLAFHKWSMVPGTDPVFVGFDNFVRLLHTQGFAASIGNTVFYMLGLLPFSLLLPLILATTTQQMEGRMKQVYRAMFFIPMILAPVSVSAIWRWLFHPSNGLVNHLMVDSGIWTEAVAYFSDPNWAKWIILLITGWKMAGFSTLMFAAALSGINREYYEAAAQDGAGRWQQLWHITLPLLSPMIFFMLMMSILFSSQWTFAYIDILTAGGPYGTSTNIYYEMYKYAFSNLNAGFSAAAAMLFFIVFGLIALAMTALSRRYAFHDN